MTLKTLSLQTPAKINPVLEVLGKRTDGYHELVLIFQAVGLYDELSFSEAEEGIQLSIDGLPLDADDSNLVVKASKIFFQDVLREKRGVKIRLQKRIPLAAGLGGGSSDAAATLKGLDWLFETKASEETLLSLAAQLGSDVPFFLKGGTALGTGRGEKIESWAPGPELHIVLVKPLEGLSTPAVYQSGKARFTSGERARGFSSLLGNHSPKEIAGSLFNGLEAAAQFLMPEVGEIKKRLLEAGALGALVSGSGPTVFGIAESGPKAVEVAHRLEGKGWMVFATQTVSAGIEKIEGL